MQMTAQEIIEGYVKEVVKYLPQNLKEEVKAELTSHLWESSAGSTGGETTPESAREACTRMGAPRELALRYLPEEAEKKIFITSALYPAFVKWTALLVLFLFVIVSVSVGSALLEEMTLYDLLIKGALFLTAILATVGIMILIFALLSRKGVLIKRKSRRMSTYRIRSAAQLVAAFILVPASLCLIFLPVLYESIELSMFFPYVGVILGCHAVLLLFKAKQKSEESAAYQQLNRATSLVNLLLFPGVFFLLIRPDIISYMISGGVESTEVSYGEMISLLQSLLILWMAYVIAKQLWVLVIARFLSWEQKLRKLLLI